MDDSQILITGANGQVGTALKQIYPDARFTDSDELDITNPAALKNYDWQNIKVIVNAAAYTNVDGAETQEGREIAWNVNAKAVSNLVDIASQHDILFVHISTAYVFDGKKKVYTEDDEFNPLGEYAKTKAAADKEVAKLAKYYIVRTDSVIGEGKNFVRTMLGLGRKGVEPKVVADQIIRPTFTIELAEVIKFLVDSSPPYGTYNLTNEGEPISWADLTRAIFKEAGFKQKVIDTTFAEYFASKTGIAPRPLSSVLDLSKIKAAGFRPKDWLEDLKVYVKKELQ